MAEKRDRDAEREHRQRRTREGKDENGGDDNRGGAQAGCECDLLGDV